jgi:hypothetical protein
MSVNAEDRPPYLIRQPPAFLLWRPDRGEKCHPVPARRGEKRVLEGRLLEPGRFARHRARSTLSLAVKSSS